MPTDADLLRKVDEVRSSIALAAQLSAAGPLRAVLADARAGESWVVKVLDVHPCTGKVGGRRLLRTLGIAERSRLRELTDAQRESLAGSCSCSHD